MQWKSVVLRCLAGAVVFVAAGTLIAQERLAPVVAASTPTFSARDRKIDRTTLNSNRIKRIEGISRGGG